MLSQPAPNRKGTAISLGQPGGNLGSPQGLGTGLDLTTLCWGRDTH